MDPIEDNQHYKFGIFYYNVQDDRTIISKKSKLGWTVNFGKLDVYLFFVITGGLLYIISMDK